MASTANKPNKPNKPNKKPRPKPNQKPRVKSNRKAQTEPTASPPKRARRPGSPLQGRSGPGRPPAGAGVREPEILARGLEAFATRGFEGTSIRDLARDLGVSHNFIHDRYGSKDGFWRAVVDAALHDAGAAVEAALDVDGAVTGAPDAGAWSELAQEPVPTDDDLARLRAVVRHIAGVSGPRAQLQAMLAFEAGGASSSRMLYIFERHIQPFVLKLTPVISRLVQAGVLRPVPWHVLFFLLTAPSASAPSAPLAELLGRPRNAEAESAALFADLVIDALRAR